MKWPTLKQVLVIRGMAIGETGGVAGILNVERADSAVSRPFAAFEGQEMFLGLWSKVAALIHGIATAHPFVDGNKRTAPSALLRACFVVADVCLKLNGFRLVPSDEAQAFFWSIARGQQTVETVAEWLETHAQEEGTKE